MSAEENLRPFTPEEAAQFMEDCKRSSASMAEAWNAMKGQEKEMARRMVWELICGLPQDLRDEIEDACAGKARMEGA